MKWLARLKKTGTGTETEPTKPTKTVSVVFVAPTLAHIQKIEGETPAANDPAPDPDRWCWPYSAAMNTAEIDTFTARLARFTDRGLDLPAGEQLADRLVTRDREKDDRAVCLECTHLQRGRRCANGQQAGVSIRAWDAQLPGDFVGLLQRCEGFTQSIHLQGGNHGQA